MDGEDTDRTMTPGEILGKVQWEGGWDEAFNWGLKPEHSDDPEIQRLIAAAKGAWDAFGMVTRELDGVLEARAEPEVVDEC